MEDKVSFIHRRYERDLCLLTETSLNINPGNITEFWKVVGTYLSTLGGEGLPPSLRAGSRGRHWDFRYEVLFVFAS